MAPTFAVSQGDGSARALVGRQGIARVLHALWSAPSGAARSTKRPCALREPRLYGGRGLRRLRQHHRHVCAQTRQLSLSSYDRLFPNQDRMPKGGFGNLIALPLQKNHVSRDLGVGLKC